MQKLKVSGEITPIRPEIKFFGLKRPKARAAKAFVQNPYLKFLKNA